MEESSDKSSASSSKSFREILLVFLRLGLTSFGGPVAHVGYFRTEFVERKRWLEERAYATLVAFCQFLPGPTSSQIGLGIGLAKGGVRGAFAAWLGFTLPSALLMALFGWLVLSSSSSGFLSADGLHGLKVAAVAVVAHALVGMARSLCPTLVLAILASVAGVLAFFLAGVVGQLAAIALGGVGGFLLSQRESEDERKTPGGPNRSTIPITLPVKFSLLCIVAFALLFLALPPLARAFQNGWLDLADSFGRVGSLVFGGGHVVLPLLQAEVVPPVGKDVFLAGYGAAQAVPGPMFSFAAYLGVAMPGFEGGWSFAAGALCLVMIFLPSFLLIFGVLPFWSRLASLGRVKSVVVGINAGVVGLLGAAFINPVIVGGIRNGLDIGMACAGFAMLFFWKRPAWLVVLILGGGYAGWSAGM